MKKVLATLLALTLSCGMLASCGDTDSDSKKEGSKAKSEKKEAVSVSAEDALNAELDKLNGFESGTISMRLLADSPDSEEKLTLSTAQDWLNLASGSETGEDVAFDIDLSFNTVTTEDGKVGAGIALGGEDMLSMYYDTADLYVDLTNLKPLLTAAGASMPDDESAAALEGLFCNLKVTGDELSSLKEMLTASGVEISSEEDAKSKLDASGVFEAIGGLAEKAEYDGTDIKITGITEEDFQPVMDALDSAFEVDGAMGTEDEAEMPDDMLTSEDEIEWNVLEDSAEIVESVEADDTEADDSASDASASTVDYKLSFDGKGINQVHTITSVAENGTVVSLEITISDKEEGYDYAVDTAKTFTDIFGMDMPTFLNSMMADGTTITDEDM